MLELSRYCLVAGTGLIIAAALAYLVILVTQRRTTGAARTATPAMVRAGGAPATHPISPISPAAADELPAPGGRRPARGMLWFSSRLVELGLALLTLCLVFRTIAVGHAPFSNQYEFAVSFAWGIVAAYVYFEHRYRVRALALLVLPIASAMLLYASSISAEAAPLIPALQNHLLLTLHVITAVAGYGAAAIAFGAAALYLLQPRLKLRGLPSRETLDEIGYRAVVLAFPLMTIMNILGALWASIAWGRYWSWDPKETASLVTWLIYGAYLHARVVRDWRGNRAAWLLILGFVAVLFTYFGNLFFGGLHAYA